MCRHKWTSNNVIPFGFWMVETWLQEINLKLVRNLWYLLGGSHLVFFFNGFFLMTGRLLNGNEVVCGTTKLSFKSCSQHEPNINWSTQIPRCFPSVWIHSQTNMQVPSFPPAWHGFGFILILCVVIWFAVDPTIRHNTMNNVLIFSGMMWISKRNEWISCYYIKFYDSIMLLYEN